MANTNTNYIDNGSLAKPPRFSKDNFTVWKERMTLFLEGSDPKIPYYLENGPYVPTVIVPSVPATATTPAVAERRIPKTPNQWSEEDKKELAIDSKARSIIAMSLSDDVYHSVMKMRTSKSMWDTLCVQYEGTNEVQLTRSINLVRQYESFMHLKGETLSQTHQRFNCLLIDMKSVNREYSNAEILTKFMEALPEKWKVFTTCLKMSKNLETLTLSALYGILLNEEQSEVLRDNLVKEVKGAKSTSLALISSGVEPPKQVSSSITSITELKNSEELTDADIAEFDNSLALLSNNFRKFARKSNFRKPLSISDSDKSKTPVADKASSTCFNCQRKGHFANECRSKKVAAPTTSLNSDKKSKYFKLKNKYRDLKKNQRKGKGLIAEEVDWADSTDESESESESDEEDSALICLMARIEEAEEANATASSETPSTQVSIPENSVIPDTDSLSAFDSLTVDFYNALNGKTKAENINLDLTEQLKNCHLKIKELLKVEDDFKNQVFVNQALSIEKQQAIAEREKAIADLKAEKATIEGWCKSSEKINEIINAQIPSKVKSGLGYSYDQEEEKDRSMLKFGTFVSSIPDPSSQKASISEIRPSNSKDKGKND